jgi:amino acid transporter
VIVVYMLIAVGCIRYYLGPGREHFNPLLHVVLPIGGIVLFFFPLYYQFVKAPSDYPVRNGNWVALGWFVIGLVLTAWLVTRRRDKLADMQHVYVDEDEPVLEPA